MSKSLTIRCEPIDQPAATDPLEGRTWCALSIFIGGRTITRLWDKQTETERAEIYVPVFPIAEWIVENWWALVNEPHRGQDIPDAVSVTRRLSTSVTSPLPWIKRHCLRSASSGLLLPSLYLFNDGQGVSAVWQADRRGTLPNMRGEFTDSGSDQLTVSEVIEAFAEFITTVLNLVNDLDDERVHQIKANWKAIQSASANDEADFCITAGRMGLNPYDPTEVPDAVAEVIEAITAEPDLPWRRDLTEVATVADLAEKWDWVRHASDELKLGPIRNEISLDLSEVGSLSMPHEFGYEVARQYRSRVGIDEETPVFSLEETASKIAGASLRAESRNHLKGRTIQAVVGWSDSNEAIIAGPPVRPESNRFRIARGIYHALFSCKQSQRLVTDAHTREQQASRAFAAEFLAPQQALVSQTGDWADGSQVENLARTYQVSPRVIERQLQNAGVELVADY